MRKIVDRRRLGLGGMGGKKDDDDGTGGASTLSMPLQKMMRVRARRDEQRIALIDGLEAFATVEPPRDWRAGNVRTRRGSRTQLGVGYLFWALSLVELGDDGG